MAFPSFRILLLCWLVYQCRAKVRDGDDEICVKSTESYGLIPPPLPENFMMKAGKTRVDNKTLLYEEYYFDYTNLQAKYVYLSEGIEHHFIFDYTTEQIIKYYKLHPGMESKNDAMAHVCVTERIQGSDLQHLFGYKGGQFMTKHARMYNPYQVLRYGGEYPYAANGSELLESRGFTGNKFVGCVHDADVDMMANTTYYFSKESLQTSGGIGWDEMKEVVYNSVPVAAKYNGVQYVKYRDEDGTSQELKTTFNEQMSISWFQPEPEFNYNTFKIPPWTYCKGYKGAKPMPKFPVAFTTRVESTVFSQDEFGKMMTAEILTAEQIFYNYKMGLARRDFTPVPERDGEIYQKFENYGPVKQIYDFNDGTTYIIHKNSGRCYTRSIRFGDYFETSKEEIYTMMGTAEEIFLIDAKKQEYKGKYFVRDIETDAWAGIAKITMDDKTDIEFMRETYFATDGWHEDADDKTEYTAVPIRQTTLVDSSADGEFRQIVTAVNFFKFNQATPQLIAFDTQGCVENLERSFLVITLSLATADEDLINKNKWYFQQAVQVYLAEASQIGTPLRVQRVRLLNAHGQYLLTFTMTGKALSKSLAQEPGLSLEKATEKLYNYITDGKFVIKITLPGDSKEKTVTGSGLYSLPQSGSQASALSLWKHLLPQLRYAKREAYAYLHDEPKKPVIEVKRGMSPGGLAGLCIAMLIIGGGVGIAVMYLYIRRYSDQGQSQFPMK